LTIINARADTIVNYLRCVTPPPDDLLDAGEVAEIIGLSSRTAVSAYRGRYDDFPEPYVEKSGGKCILWLRSDIERWSAGHRRQPGPAPGTPRKR
jgi:predicted DNA-binding transcriptional regulator AlpA